MSTKCLVAAAKFLVAATNILSVVPNFVAVSEQFFPCGKFGSWNFPLLVFYLRYIIHYED